MRHTDKAPEQLTTQPERMQNCANTPQENLQNTGPGSWQPCSSSIFFFFKKRKTSFSYPFSFSLNQPNESIKLIIKSKGELDILHDSVGYIQLQTEQKPSQKIMQRPCRKGKSIGKDERSKFSGFGFCNLPFFQSGHTMFHICGTIFFWHYLDTSSLPLPLSC